MYVPDYRDNGIGLSGEIDLKRETTLGMTLIHGLVNQHRGTIEVNRDSGMQFIITFPAREQKGNGDESGED